MSQLKVNSIVPVGGVASGQGGGVIQVTHGSTSSATTVQSTSFQDTGLSATITPQSTSNKILVIVSQQIYYQRNNTQAHGGLQLVRTVGGSSTNIYTGSDDGPNFGIYLGSFGNDTRIGMYGHLNVVDSPSTTSAITYKMQVRCRTTSDSALAVAQEESTPSHITLMEVSA